jgi:hypothetical protein
MFLIGPQRPGRAASASLRRTRAALDRFGAALTVPSASGEPPAIQPRPRRNAAPGHRATLAPLAPAWHRAGVIYIWLNLQAILAATLAGLAAGALIWRPRPTARLVLTALTAETWLCAILAGALILAPPRADRLVMGFGSAVIIWVGFVLPAIAVTHAYRALSGRAAARDAARWLVTMVVQAAVLMLIGLTPPPR